MASSRLGVVREPGQIGRAARWVGKRRQRPAMQAHLPVGRHRLLDGEPGELVPERHARRLGDEHAGGQALVETVGGIAG